jgi:hypothetical protein
VRLAHLPPLVEPACGLDSRAVSMNITTPPTREREQKFAANCLQSRVVSMGRCNTGLEFTCRSFKAQSFSRALIEAQGYLVEVGL